MAAQTEERQRKGPLEKDLRPPLETKEIVLSTLWGIMATGLVAFLIYATISYHPPESAKGNNMLCGALFCLTPKNGLY